MANETKCGVVGIELELTLAFHPDGTLSGMRSIAAEGVALPAELATALWNHLRDLKPADALIEAAWYAAEEESE